MKLSDLRSAETVHQEDMANDPDYREEYLKNRLANQVAIEVIRWRTEHNLTQTALAKLLGMRQPNVSVGLKIAKLGPDSPSFSGKKV